jgi:uncharacterized protein (TIGR02099 family)
VLLRYSFAFLKHGSLWGYRLATWAVLVAGLLFVCAVLALRYWLLPAIDDFRAPIVRTIARAVGQPVEISHLEGSWRGYRPELRLHGLKIMDAGGQPALELARVDAVLSWVALLSAKLNFHSIEFDGAAIELRRDPAGTLWIAGSAVGSSPGRGGGFVDWLLAQRQVVVRKARISWRDELRGAPPLVVEDATFRLDNDGAFHRFGLTGKPPPELAAPVSIRGALSGGPVADSASWSGRIYAEFEYANLALLQSWVASPIRLGSGLGTLRLWIQLAAGRIGSATADTNLVNVHARLGEELEPLAMRSLAGRLVWRAEPGGYRIGASRLGFATADGVVLPVVDIEMLRRGELTEVSIDGLELAPVVELAERLPLDPRVRERLAATSPSGRIDRARLQWQGRWDPDLPYSVQADLDSLQWRPLGALPGAKGVSGQVSANQHAGSLSLRASAGALELPRVFEETVPLDFLSAEVDWRWQDDRVLVTVRSAVFTNDHAAGNVSGSYLSDPGGKGTADFSGQLVRADARSVWRYIPRFAPGTQRWLRRALVRGGAQDVRFALRGPLERFPFRDGEGGRFEVVSRVRGITLDYAPGWPAAEGIDATVAFRGAAMEIESTAGRLFGVDVGGTRAAIPVLGNRDEHLILEGRGSGPLADYLQFVASSPVAGYTNGMTAKMRAEGEGRLRIDIDLPLRRAREAKVAGTLDIAAREFTVDPRVPALTDAQARVEFSEKSVAVRDGQALLHGAALRFAGGTQRAGGVRVTLDGRLDAAALQRTFDGALAARPQGAADWKGTLTVAGGRSTLRVESSLVGMALGLPPPFSKPADAPLAFKLAVLDQPGAGELIRAELGSLASAQLAVVSGELIKGEIRLGREAVLPAGEGLRLAGRVETVDLDAWRRWRTEVSGAGDGARLSALDLSIGRLTMAGRAFHGVQIKGARATSGWQLRLDAVEGSGEVAWAESGTGRLAAHFASLAIPSPQPELRSAQAPPGPQANLPALEMVADNFVFEGKSLGRLELKARAAADSWELDSLTTISPEGTLAVTGRWLLSDPPRTELDVRIEASDIGRWLVRLGYDEGVNGGKGSLSGAVQWLGAPYRVDLPSLSGQLKLEARQGRLARLEPGVGKLLGILSLQAIPRRLALDFRDLFSTGFSFERISADVALAGGIARTENFRMEGSAARVEMKGQVDLAAESQDLRLRVLPQLSTGVAIAGAVVNPAVGVATLLAQKALGDPVEKLAAQDYQVSGTWAEPKVERVVQKIEPASPRR